MQKRNWKSKSWRSAAQLLLGSLGLALATLVCFRLGLNLATAAFAYLIVIVLISLMGSTFASAILSIIAVGGLNYFFATHSYDGQTFEPIPIGQTQNVFRPYKSPLWVIGRHNGPFRVHVRFAPDSAIHQCRKVSVEASGNQSVGIEHSI